MTRKKAVQPVVGGISLASSEPVLFYSGGPVYGDVPARDLTAGDLAYIWRVAGLRESGGLPVGSPTPADLEATAALLSSTGAFSQEASARNDPPIQQGPLPEPGEPAEVIEEPAGPADEE